jgi:hypothetical protein
MPRRNLILVSVIGLLAITGCIKDTYNLKMLSKKAHLSPEMAISAAKADFSLSNIVKTNDTIVFDNNKLLTFIFRNNSIIDLKLSDFAKGIVLKKTATIDPSSVDLNIKDFMKHITGEFKISNPIIKLDYINSFADSIKLDLNISGKKDKKTVALNLAPFGLAKPNLPLQKEISAEYIINKTNSNLPDLVSLPPDVINFSGSATVTSYMKNAQTADVLAANHLTASVEIYLPMELKLTNLQFADTVNNFLQENNDSNNPLSPEDFQFLQVKIDAKNGFPLDISLKMSLYNSSTHSIISTVNAGKLLSAAPVDSNGKVTGTSESTSDIEFTRAFFSSIDKADKIIFWLTMNTTATGLPDVKIYSDYRVNLSAALVVKPDIDLK